MPLSDHTQAVPCQVGAQAGGYEALEEPGHVNQEGSERVRTRPLVQGQVLQRQTAKTQYLLIRSVQAVKGYSGQQRKRLTSANDANPIEPGQQGPCSLQQPRVQSHAITNFGPWILDPGPGKQARQEAQ